MWSTPNAFDKVPQWAPKNGSPLALSLAAQKVSERHVRRELAPHPLQVVRPF
jgi:hypothetical protein